MFQQSPRAVTCSDELMFPPPVAETGVILVIVAVVILIVGCAGSEGFLEQVISSSDTNVVRMYFKGFSVLV